MVVVVVAVVVVVISALRRSEALSSPRELTSVEVRRRRRRRGGGGGGGSSGSPSGSRSEGDGRTDVGSAAASVNVVDDRAGEVDDVGVVGGKEKPWRETLSMTASAWLMWSWLRLERRRL